MRVSTVLASTGRSSLRVSTVLARRRSRSRSGLGSCGGCCASNGAIFRHPGCPLVLFVLTETVIEYAGRRAARYGAAMRQHVREGTELLACAALSELILSEALPSRLCSDGSCSRARLARRVFHSMLPKVGASSLDVNDSGRSALHHSKLQKSHGRPICATVAIRSCVILHSRQGVL